MKDIVIVGGGFAGVACALTLARKQLSDTRIRLVSNRTHFEYHGALYRVITGRTPLEVCVPLSEIFESYDIEVVHDQITTIDVGTKFVRGKSESTYSYDYLVLALGGNISYYGIPGLAEYAFSIISIHDALKLKRHLHQQFDSCVRALHDEQVCATHIVVVGGGATGTETAAELAVYTKKLAQTHNVNPEVITIDLIEAGDRLVSTLPPEMSKKIQQRLERLGVTVMVNKKVVSKDIEQLYLEDMKVRAKTVVWAAGVQGNSLYTASGLATDTQGRVLVNDYLQARGHDNVFVVGDGAATKYTGMAQTALHDGVHVAKNIARDIKQKYMVAVAAKQPIYAIPVGSRWAAVLKGDKQYYGWYGWMLRRQLDWHVFKTLLPLPKAFRAFRYGAVLSETCPVCCEDTTA